jgi:uncharacterized coiled-coil protein SlyX
MDNAFLEVNLRKLDILDKKLIELEMKGGGDDEFPLREVRSMLSGMKFEIAKLQGQIKELTTVKKETPNVKEGKKK